MMNSARALAFVREHGVVLVSARGPVPALTEAIAGEVIRGSWWGHPKGKQIFAVLEEVGESDEVLVCRLVGGKVSMVHRRLWPALVAVAGSLPASQVCKVTQVHTAGGRHRNVETAFPDWVPAGVLEEARTLALAEARAALGASLAGNAALTHPT